jgi:hypothetical protein
VIRQPAAFDTKIVNYVAQAQVGVHWLRVYQYPKYCRAVRKTDSMEFCRVIPAKATLAVARVFIPGLSMGFLR